MRRTSPRIYRDGQVEETICTDSTRRCGEAVFDSDAAEDEVVRGGVPLVVVPPVVVSGGATLDVEASCPVIRT